MRVSTDRSEHRAFLYGQALRRVRRVDEAGHSSDEPYVGASAWATSFVVRPCNRDLSVHKLSSIRRRGSGGLLWTESGVAEHAGGVNGYTRFWSEENDRPTPDYHQAPNGAFDQRLSRLLNMKGIGGKANRIVNFHNVQDFCIGNRDEVLCVSKAELGERTKRTTSPTALLPPSTREIGDISTTRTRRIFPKRLALRMCTLSTQIPCGR